mmetsp:Transcript_2542/g.10140  ORF Transcript_2542/g.10140 Transcript_2542/m.10140 type:complete len:247 (-) Transcript_2542:3255-3995(-)
MLTCKKSLTSQGPAPLHPPRQHSSRHMSLSPSGKRAAMRSRSMRAMCSHPRSSMRATRLSCTSRPGCSSLMCSPSALSATAGRPRADSTAARSSACLAAAESVHLDSSLYTATAASAFCSSAIAPSRVPAALHASASTSASRFSSAFLRAPSAAWSSSSDARTPRASAISAASTAAITRSAATTTSSIKTALSAASAFLATSSCVFAACERRGRWSGNCPSSTDSAISYSARSSGVPRGSFLSAAI